MGRFPFVAYANEYMEVVGPTFSEDTRKERMRRYRRMDKDFRALVEEGKASTHNPEKITDRDVIAFIGRLRSRGVGDTGIQHEISALSSLLKFNGNGAVEKARLRVPSAFPKKHTNRLPPMSEAERAHIIQEAEKVPENDWRRLEAYAMSVTAMCSGLRSKELRLSNLSDLDTINWTIHTDHVKGEGKYGQPRDPPIDPDGRKTIERYIKVRNRIVEERWPENKALFPALNDRGGDGYFATNSLGKLREIIRKETAIDFDGRKCRRTYGQKCVDDGLSIESLSLLLGHNNTNTTEGSYCRKKEGKAVTEVQKIWAERDARIAATVPPIIEPKQKQECKNLLIENKFAPTGYQ